MPPVPPSGASTLDALCPVGDGELAWIHLLIVMCWPGDAERQYQAHRALFLGYLGKLETLASSENEWVSGLAELDSLRRELGGWSQIAEAPPLSQIQQEIQHREAEGFVAGGIMRLLHALSTQNIEFAGSPSLNKVLDFLGRFGSSIFGQERCWDKRTLLYLWKTYRDVAHLWAAHVSLCPIVFPNFPVITSLSDSGMAKRHYRYSSYVLQVYCVAKRFQEFGLGFKAKYAKATDATLLDLGSPYLLGSIPSWETYPLRKLSLNEEMLDALKAYRAPKAI